VLDDVRRNIALELARDANLSQSDIAVRLGFSDIRSLQRYFRRWTGMTFGEYREQAGN
jgi:AraC-like DNA-binding protein